MLGEKYGIGTFQEYFIDQETSILQFKNDEDVVGAFDIVFIGSHSKEESSWTWANESIMEKNRVRASVLKEMQEMIDGNFFTYPKLKCDEYLAHEITALSLEHLNAKWAYFFPILNGSTYLFVAIMDEKQKNA